MNSWKVKNSKCYRAPLPNMKLYCGKGPTNEKCEMIFTSFADQFDHFGKWKHWKCEPCDLAFATKQEYRPGFGYGLK